MKSSADIIADYNVEKSRDMDVVEVLAICEKCSYLTVEEMLQDHALKANFVQCHHCGEWVRL